MSQTSVARASMTGSLLNARNLGFLPRTVIDVGAALGTFQLYEVFPEARHVMIEPIAENEPYLAKLCRKLGRAEYLIAAATRTSGDFTLTVDPNLVHSMTHAAAPTETSEVWVRTIPGVTLDQLVEERQLEPPFLIKVDVDGNEAEVLAGATKTLEQTEYLIVEVSLFGQINDVIDEMRSHGFVAYDMVDLSYRPTDRSLWQLDMAFVKQDGMFRQDRSYMQQQSDPAAQKQFSHHMKSYRDHMIAQIDALPDATAAKTEGGDRLWLAVCPDWSQPEPEILQDLAALFRSVMLHPERQKMTLLFDSKGIGPEQVDLMLSTVAIQLAMDEQIDVTVEGPEVVLMEVLSEEQWQELLPDLWGQIVLPHMRGRGHYPAPLKTLPHLALTDLAGQRFPQG